MAHALKTKQGLHPLHGCSANDFCRPQHVQFNGPTFSTLVPRFVPHAWRSNENPSVVTAAQAPLFGPMVHVICIWGLPAVTPTAEPPGDLRIKVLSRKFRKGAGKSMQKPKRTQRSGPVSPAKKLAYQRQPSLRNPEKGIPRW